MKEENVIQKKSYDFAIKITQVYHHLIDSKKEFVLGKQLLRSGTSFGANIEEAIGTQSKKDFFMKITTAYKETRETIYWLCLLSDTNILNVDIAQNLLKSAQELQKIIGAIQNTMRKNHIGNS